MDFADGVQADVQLKNGDGLKLAAGDQPTVADCIKVQHSNDVEIKLCDGERAELVECDQAEPLDDSPDDFNARQVYLVKYIAELFAKLD